MTSDIIRKQIDSLCGQNLVDLQQLATIALVLQLVHFVSVWIAELWDERPLSSLFQSTIGTVPTAETTKEAYQFALQGDIPLLAASLCILILVVLYFFWLRNRPMFHAFFIGNKVESKPASRKHVLLSLLVISTSIGLAFTAAAYYNIERFSFFVSNHWWSSSANIFYPFYPLIIVICVNLSLYFMYRVRFKRVRRTLPLLLFVPTMLSLVVMFERLVDDALNYYYLFIVHNDVVGYSLRPYANTFVSSSYEILILASFLVLFYLTYYYTKIERKGASTHIKKGALQGLVEEAVFVLPQKVREDDSHFIWLELKPSEDFVKRGALINERGSHENSPYSSGDYLEAELQGVGLTVDGEKQLKVGETSPLPITTWSCSFTKHGIQRLNLMLSVVNPTDNTKQLLFILNHDVCVDSFLTMSWAPIVALVAPILAVLVQVLLRLR